MKNLLFGILVGILLISVIDDYTWKFSQWEWKNVWGVIRIVAIAIIAFVRGYQVHKYKEANLNL